MNVSATAAKRDPARRVRRTVGAALAGMSLLVLEGCGRAPTQVNMIVSMAASSDINPNSRGQPSPVVVRVYALKSEDLFKGADFFTLWDKEKQVLGADLLVRREYEVQPGGKVSKTDPINAETTYIGVVAAFREINSATWRAIIKANKGSTNRIHIVVGGNSIRIERTTNNWLLRQFSEMPRVMTGNR
jgi:type VI secretion system protein VasD